MFESILVANRGEVACRIVRTARRLGIRTIAVYSDADAQALHVRTADLAVRIGPAPARESYLNIEAIMGAAARSGASAIHPGYGFLSENAEFAAACEAAGLVFIGPPAAAIRAMGSKIEAKRLMARAGVPTVPGYQEDDQHPARLEAAAGKLGYPVLIKASAGGGGKGMRVVASPDVFIASLEGARREALAAFGDDRVLLEKYLARPRHIEMQVFADRHGNCIHLNERDCSIQRRHQKVIEEAPAPGMTAARRRAMGTAAVKAATAVGYQGAGTVEFIVADGEFYFMEMNTRLQVEHPVTEMTTGLDLVEWQIRVAADEPLPLEQVQVPLRGHAIEARLYAEDPQRENLPSTGRLLRLRWPEIDGNLRIDTGVQEGDVVSVHYDPMLAKVIAWGEDRGSALRRLHYALGTCQIAGVATNVALLRAILETPEFASGAVHTSLIEERAGQLLKAPDADEDIALRALAAMGWLLSSKSAGGQPGEAPDARNPWDERDGWQLNLQARATLQFTEGDGQLLIELEGDQDRWQVAIGTRRVSVEAVRIEGDRVAGQVDGRPVNARWVADARRLCVMSEGRTLELGFYDPVQGGERERHGGGLISPMPGQVLQVMVVPGATVRRGQPLMIVEAMKMEHTILAPEDGVVETVHFSAGERVSEGDQLLRLKPSES